MIVTEVKIRLIPPKGNGDDRLLAFCSVVIDNAIVIHGVKVINGPKGPFMAVPSRKLTDYCVNCNTKNHRIAKFCNECGDQLPLDRFPQGEDLYSDIVHPIHPAARKILNDAVLGTYSDEEKVARSKETYDYDWATYDFQKEYSA